MSAFAHVLANPGSLAARRALMAEWKAQHDPRGQLIEKQLEYRDVVRRDGPTSRRARELDREIDALIRNHGRAWAGRLAEIVTEYKFKRGLIARVNLPGEKFLAVADELFGLAPIQHLTLTKPLGDFAAIAKSPYLQDLATLEVSNHGAAFGDAGAIALANSPHMKGLRMLDVWNDAITDVGVEAMTASPNLAHVAYIGFDGNPANPTPTAGDYEGFPTSGRPGLADDLERRFGPRPWLTAPAATLEAVQSWPPNTDELAITE